VVGDDEGRLRFLGPNGSKIPPVTNLGPIAAAPTLMPDGRIAVIARTGFLSILRSNGVHDSTTDIVSASIASVAASCTHLFVSTTEELTTWDIAHMTPVATVTWTKGGTSAPVVGPAGHVYAVAGETMFVFPGPPPPTISLPGVPARTKCDVNGNGR